MEQFEQKYTPKEIQNKNRTIQKMKKNKEKRDKTKNSRFPVKGIYILTELIKKQNLIILEKIADDKFNSEEEKQIFINKYNKPNYYVPDISDKIEVEKTQEIILKTM
tara:strand:+ start:26 stop:346 length:321 start_codon:yes stop_codon:yes gene_type:complete